MILGWIPLPDGAADQVPRLPGALAVAVLLFLFYIPDDIFAERVLGMH